MAQSKMNGVFLDTNVLLDYCLGREAGCADCTSLIGQLMQADIAALVCSASLKDLFYVTEGFVKKQARADHGGVLTAGDAAAARRIAWACIDQVLSFAMVPHTSYPECREAYALRGLHGDFEDNLVVATALHCGADYLVTSDEVLLRHAPIACLTPRDMLTMLRAGGGEEEAIE